MKRAFKYLRLLFTFLVLYRHPLCGFLILYYDYPFTIFTTTFTYKNTNFL